MYILSPPLLRLTSRKPLWLDLQPVDIKSRWRHNWKSAQVVNAHLVCDPTIPQLGFDHPRQQWSLPNRFHTEQGHCGTCRRKWRLTDTDLCTCGETQMMSHIVESCPPDKTEWRMKMLFYGWPVMVHETYTRKKRLNLCNNIQSQSLWLYCTNDCFILLCFILLLLYLVFTSL